MTPTPPPELREALALREQGQTADALRRLRDLHRRTPDDIGVLFYLGAMEVESGNATAALPHLQAVLRAQPSQPGAMALLGDAYHVLGMNAEAVDLWRGHLQQSPDDIHARLKLMEAFLKNDSVAEADQEADRVLPYLAHDADALLAIGMTYHGATQLEQAIGYYQRSLEVSPGRRDTRRSMAAAMQALGDAGGAEQTYRGLLKEQEKDPEVLRDLGTLLKDSDRLPEALECYERAMRIGRRRLTDDEVAEAGRDPMARRTTLHSLRLELEQIEYLRDFGVVIEDAEALTAAYRSVIGEVQSADNEGRRITLSASQFERIGGVMQRLINVEPADRLADGALNPELDSELVTRQFAEGGPRVAVIDDFLRPEALAALRAYCLRSTIWFGFARVRGYCGAYMQDGFGCGLLEQLSAEIRSRWPGIVGPHPLNQMWGYIYDQKMSGITAHADPAAINLNFWITPDDANLDPERGGLVVGTRRALQEWDFQQYNNRPEVLESFMAEGETIAVPHRCNRMVMFDSDFVHKTDDLTFQPGFENRRINITLLFGHRQT